MQRTWIGFFCVCMLLCSAFSAKAASHVSSEAQKRMSIVLSEVTRTHVDSVQPEQFFDPKHPEELLFFAAYYVERMYGLSKARLAPALLKEGGAAPLGERLVRLEDVKNVVKRFFDYDLPSLAPKQYGSVYFDGKDFHLRMAAGAPAYWAQVKEASVLDNGNISVQGALRDPEHGEVATFTAQLKPILWKSLQTYAVVSLTTTKKGE